MKVLMVNGSPRGESCTYTALKVVAEELEKQGIETEIVSIGNKQVRGCIACGACRKNDWKCVFDDDIANEIIEKAKTSDGFIFGSPVHYAAASGEITAIMDRVFFAGSKHFKYKPGAAIVSARRGGTSAALDQLNKYFTINCMPVVSSTYWNMVHGTTPDEVKQDLEGMQVMQNLGKNMAWILKSIEAGKKAGIEVPTLDKGVRTNFIR